MVAIEITLIIFGLLIVYTLTHLYEKTKFENTQLKETIVNKDETIVKLNKELVLTKERADHLQNQVDTLKAGRPQDPYDLVEGMLNGQQGI